MTRRPPTPRAVARMQLYAESSTTIIHATATVTCKTCRDRQTMFTFSATRLGQHWAQTESDRKAQSWLSSHPCRPALAVKAKEAA